MSRPTVAILRDGLWTHPAVQAWIELRPATVTPESIMVLREHRESGVYRLVGVGPAGAAVIAKRCPYARAAIEREVYECILPHLPVTAPRYYGAWAVDGQSCWLFLEDVGEKRYSESNMTHVVVTAKWLAQLHTSAANHAAAHELPDGGPGRYLAHLCAGREMIRRRLSCPAFTPRDVTMLESIILLQDLLESQWSRIEQCCVGLPATLVHGDFQPQNVFVRGHGTGITCYPVDWEMAGWGVPAADLTRIDVVAYWAATRDHWEGLDLDTVRRLANVGQLLFTLAAIDWDSVRLQFESPHALSRPLASLQVLERRLADAVRTAGVTDR